MRIFVGCQLLRVLTNGILLAIICDIWHQRYIRTMIIKTKVFELSNGTYRNLSELARAMELSVSQVYRVRGKLDELFYLDSNPGFGNPTGTVATER